MAVMFQPGDRAETHGMSVSQLNGRKGTIVCYMEDSDRYLLEIDDATTMSLRKTNLKAEGVNGNAGEDKKNDGVRDDHRSTLFQVDDIVRYRRVDGTTSRAMVFDVGPIVNNQPITYAIRILSNNVEMNVPANTLELLVRQEAKKKNNQVRPITVLESLFFSAYEALESATWLTFLVAFVAIRWMWMSVFDDGTVELTRDNMENFKKNRYNDYYYSYHPRYWYWTGIVGGLGSFLLVGFVAHKFGTDNGKRAFSWDRVWQGLYDMDVWTLIRFAGILEVALHFLGNVAGGGRRR